MLRMSYNGRLLTFLDDFSSEATEPVLLKFHMEPS